ncbi:9c3cd026-1ee0-42b1-b286-945124d990a7 [Thermothielavioides terrestris]|uniref:Uncharacterized protein n=2 Tax=Thermothielavioides terrestris TaxID=2587410 RepID=G2R3X0_THETT|nr:uncharacterized protein THITE_2115279 [Thermothielavioides terrestris NRRL 8126]AEO66822.1 hypothetical protein THITE_2115279 [Thermothielavioides terrestris NRRL 8126]SPQ19954.1 9c3cd026-1ee0-42b1-b286-945124d990a7 [Thermothielavioides terrestris]
MAQNSPGDLDGLSSSDPAASEGNWSVQVQLDASSDRGRSIRRRGRGRSPSTRPSASGTPEQSLSRQATTNSFASIRSSQPSSQPSQNEPTPAEDLLRDLIAVTEVINSALNGALHGVKRPHDDKADDEPLAKRDKLGEELERMAASHPAEVAASALPGSPGFSTSAAAAYNGAANNGPAAIQSDLRLPPRTRNALPARARRRRRPGLGNGTATVLGGIPESDEPVSPGDDGSEHSSGGQGA